ncbi:CcmD family protein [Balneola sp. MJW-20]|uniref:CcmD family protein n=1 Tax=Gracilimonas aurantiaca TaxID=3234185 RepID=UPI003466BB9B
MQQDTTAVLDTLTQSYADKWAGSGAEETSAFIQIMSSNDLIFVVLGVTLIIWFILLFFLFRLDKKVGELEARINNTRD